MFALDVAFILSDGKLLRQDVYGWSSRASMPATSRLYCVCRCDLNIEADVERQAFCFLF